MEPTFFETFDPVVFSFGPVSVSWYGICFLSGACVALFFLWELLRKKNFGVRLTREECFDFSIYLVIGAILGARIGYALLYAPGFFAEHPLSLVSPLDPETGAWTGIAGMSAHGGIAGIALSIVLFARKYRKPPLPLLDVVALALPIAIFCGRIGNFVTGELFGRVTNVSWGMVFPRAGDMFPRHPSPLYEALGEGVFLFLVLLFLSKRKYVPGRLFLWATGLYGGIRFILEFFREPDPQIGFFFDAMTMGQVLSLGMIAVAIGFGWWLSDRKCATLPRA